ncbi:MAG: isoprenylcysteine carboxylmethyltransferase family protein [Deltaproteobacteria bacterium]|nr:isoprenylcysteine carboxylmethyltransferase family protein [Deltaproteobacteria bacterium]
MPDHAVFILRFCLFAFAHSLFATGWVKRAVSGKAEGEPRFYRLVYNLASIALFAWVMSAWRNSPVLYYAPGVWSLIMYLLQLVIASCLFCCLRQTGVADLLGFSQMRATTSSPPQLITSGCYGIVRHPLYLLTILFLGLNPVMTARWLLLTILSVIYFVSGALIEERRLVEQFGDEYRRYRQRVPFMIPGARRVKQPPEV